MEEGNSKYDSRNNCNAVIEKTSNTLIEGCKTTIIPPSITNIGNYAFVNCRGLSSIDIPNSVTSIGRNAFQNCRDLISIEIPNSVTSIGYSAFSGCYQLLTIISRLEEPVINNRNSLYRNTFSEVTFTNSTLYVPVGIIDKYKAAAGWSEFVNIVEYEDDVDAIENITVDGSEYQIYTIDGTLVETLQKGVNIIKYKNGTSKKVVVK